MKTVYIIGGVAAAAGLAWYLMKDKEKEPAILVYSNITPENVKKEIVKDAPNPNSISNAAMEQIKFRGVEPSTTLTPAAPTLAPIPATPTPLPASKLTIQPDISIRNSDALVTKSVTTSTKTLRGFGNAFILN